MTIDAAETMLHEQLTALIDGWRDKAKARNLGLSLQIADDFPERVVTDSMRLQTVLSILVSNAVNYTDFGQIRLRALREEDGSLRIDVADTGAGLPPELVERIFAPGAALDAIDPTGARSLLGARRIAEYLGGALAVSSRLGVGTTMRLHLPAGAPKEAPAEPQPDPRLMAATPPHPAAMAASGPDDSGFRVLAADDNPMSRMVVEALLQRMGCQPTIVEDGAQALDAARRSAFDAIILDKQMPGHDGLEVARMLRADSPNNRTPLIALTATTREHDRAQWRDAGADAVLSKPVQADALSETLRRISPVFRARRDG